MHSPHLCPQNRGTRLIRHAYHVVCERKVASMVLWLRGRRVQCSHECPPAAKPVLTFDATRGWQPFVVGVRLVDRRVLVSDRRPEHRRALDSWDGQIEVSKARAASFFRRGQIHEERVQLCAQPPYRPRKRALKQACTHKRRRRRRRRRRRTCLPEVPERA